MKPRYATDRHNRLLIKRDNQVYPLNGEFKIERNRLTFDPERKSPLFNQLRLAQRLRFLGRWRLDENYDLGLTLIESRNQRRGDQLKLHGKLIAACDNQLIFQAHCRKSAGRESISLFRLGGRWQADRYNQLRFMVGKYKREDALTFRGRWQLNRQQQITYKYRKWDLLRSTTSEEQLQWRGHWQINTRNRLTYILNLKNGSLFQFRAQLESPTLIAKKGQIRYRIGIGQRRLHKRHILTLFGKWKFGRRQDLFFELDYGQGRRQKIHFGAKVRLNKRDRFVFELTDTRGAALGFSVVFMRAFLRRNALVYARLARLKQKQRLEAGLRLRW